MRRINEIIMNILSNLLPVVICIYILLWFTFILSGCDNKYQRIKIDVIYENGARETISIVTNTLYDPSLFNGTLSLNGCRLYGVKGFYVVERTDINKQ